MKTERFPRIAKAKASPKDRELMYVKLVALGQESIRIADIIAACGKGLPYSAQKLFAAIAGVPNFTLGGATLFHGYVRLKTIACVINEVLKRQRIPARMTIITTGNSQCNG